MAEQTIGVKLLGDASSLGKAIDKANGKLGTLGGKLKQVGKFAALGLAAGAVAGGAAILKLGADFDKAYDQIAAGTGATGEQLEALSESFRNVARTGPDGFDKVAQATADLNTELGLTGPELEKATAAALDASRVFDVDLGGTISGVSDSMVIFQRDADDFTNILDFMARVSQDTGVPLDALSGKVQTFGPVLKNAGYSLEETALLFGTLEGAGIDVTRVMPALNANFRKLAQGGVTDLKGALNEQIESIKNAGTETEALSIATSAFGAEGAQRMTTAIRNDLLPTSDDLVATLLAAGGTVEELGNNSLTMGDRFAQVKNSLAVGLEPVITRVFTGLQTLLDEKVLPAVDRLSVWFEDNEEKINSALTGIGDAVEEMFRLFIVGLETIWPPLETFGRFLMDNEVAMVAAVTAVGVAMVLAFGPVSAALVAITGIVLAVGYIKENWESMRDTVLDAVDNMDPKLALLAQLFLGPIGLVIAAIKFRDEIALVAGKAKEVATVVVDAFAAMQEPIQKIIDKVQSLIDKIQSIPTPNLPSLPSVPTLPSFGIPGFASGGVVGGPTGRPTLAVVHGGEEVLTPGQRAGGGTTVINLNVTQPLGTPQQVADAVSGMLRQLEKRGTISRITR